MLIGVRVTSMLEFWSFFFVRQCNLEREREREMGVDVGVVGCCEKVIMRVGLFIGVNVHNHCSFC